MTDETPTPIPDAEPEDEAVETVPFTNDTASVLVLPTLGIEVAPGETVEIPAPTPLAEPDVETTIGTRPDDAEPGTQIVDDDDAETALPPARTRARRTSKDTP